MEDFSFSHGEILMEPPQNSHGLLQKEEILLKKEEYLIKKESLLHQEEELLYKRRELLHRQEEAMAFGHLESKNFEVKKEVLKKEEEEKNKKKKKEKENDGALKHVSAVPFLKIFKYADMEDRALMGLGLIGAIVDGISTPLTLLSMSGLMNVLGNSSPGHHFMHEITKYSLYFTYIAAGVFVACFLEAACWMRTGERQASRMRSKYLRAILRQDVGFFDLQDAFTAEVVNSVGADSLTIQDMISEKIVHFVVHTTTFIGGYLVAFYLSWRLAVVAIACLPLLVIPGLMYGKYLTELSLKTQAEYAKAAIVAEQAISYIRTVFSFVGEQKTMQKFSAALEGTLGFGLKQGLAKGLAIGSNGLTFAVWALMGWYGSTLIIHHGVNGGKIVATGLASLTGGLALGMALPNVRYFVEARIAAYRIFKMIERVPEIDSDDGKGLTFPSVNGELEVRNVQFAYPSRPDTVIFKSLSLTFPAGKTVALVGSSGSGKSTVIALLERFYDPISGEILLDGINIEDLQLKWLRAQMGLVNQEPALFATTIKDNILFGKEDATMEEIISACQKSNAHNFISQLPDGYETQVGERGVQMSGGQKQRIAIARALLKNPRILLLDEATSALDAESENIVQAALDQAAIGRTTVIVAHRLSTVRHADMIAVMQSGQVVEIGKHDELLIKPGSIYATLVYSQHDRNCQGDNTDEARLSAVRFSTSSWLSTASTPRPSNATPMHLQLLVESKPPSFQRLLALNSPEWRHAVIGCIGGIGFGMVQPLYAFTLGSTISAYFVSDHVEMRRRIVVYSSVFAVVAVLSFLTNLLQHYNFGAMGEYLTKRVRERMLEKILSFEIGWFDREENSSGAVCSRLATEANVVRSLVGDRISLVVQTFSAVVAACTFGLVISWRLAIVMIAMQPVVIMCFYTKKVLLKSQNQQASRALEESSMLAAEAVGNHRTITAFSSQDKFLQLFNSLQLVSHKQAVRHSWVAGIGLGAAQFAMFCTWGLDFWYGGKLINSGHLTGSALFKTFFILVSTGRVIADAGSMTSDIAKGATSVASVFSILDRVSQINPDEKEAEIVEKVEGNVEIRDVEFAYPARPEVMIFRNFNLKVKAGRSVALVGESGSGKSTIIGLIERFYDPQKGSVRIDAKDIRNLHLRSLRKHMALVNQEPTLFSGTVAENILYGKENATEAEMMTAAKAANAHDFISSLRDGYQTNTGDRGVQLSGGQKQRIAIARAILKNPSILLLDEATSALDAQSEKIVQEALDRIMLGRTTIVVAHRLATIQNCESIAVIQDGSIIERGRHLDLLAKGPGGAYFKLVRLQTKASTKP